MKRKRSTAHRAKARTPRPATGAALMQPAVTAALTKALFAEWARTGYGALSLEAVAKQAGVGKAALYRRWPSKRAMVKDRLEQIGIDIATLAEPKDTGSLQNDLTALLSNYRRRLRTRLVRRILPDLHAEMLRSPELASDVRPRLLEEEQRYGTAILERATGRGEIPPGIDWDLANDVLSGTIYWRMIVCDEPADDKYLDRLARFIVAGLSSTQVGKPRR